MAARFMECFAGFLSHTDAEIGRLLAHLDESGDADNTIIVLVSDNGASAEGGATGSINDVRMINRDPAGRREMRERIGELGGPSLHNNYPWGWTMAGNTPFKRWKREVHEGGVADPCIVRWPARFAGDAGQIRHQFAHAIDVLPTVLELIGVEAPAMIRTQEQSPIHGTSFAYLFDDDGATAPGRRMTQHFEMLGSRALYHDGWKAVTFKPLGPISEDLSPNSFMAPFDDDVWELYHVADDPSEVHDRADDEPERLRRMIDLWWEEAARYNVLPLDNRIMFTILNPRPTTACCNARGTGIVRTARRSPRAWRSTCATVRTRSPRRSTCPTASRRAVCCSPSAACWADGRCTCSTVTCGTCTTSTASRSTVITAEVAIGAGAHTLGFRYEKADDEGGRGELLVDGEVVGSGVVPRFTPTRYNNTGAGLSCGYELGPPVGKGYEAPFRFTGTIHEVVVEVTGEPRRDPMAEFERIMSEQ